MTAYKSPPEVAAYFGVKVDKVLHWIRTGELRAINTAMNPGGRPRFRVLEKDLADFENRRAGHVEPTPRPRINSAVEMARRPEVKKRHW